MDVNQWVILTYARTEQKKRVCVSADSLTQKSIERIEAKIALGIPTTEREKALYALYGKNEPRTEAGKSVATAAKRKRDRRAALDVYNLTAEIEGAKARRLFDPDAMRKLGVLNKTDFVRQAVDAALARLDEIEAKEKAVTDADVSGGGK